MGLRAARRASHSVYIASDSALPAATFLFIANSICKPCDLQLQRVKNIYFCMYFLFIVSS